jgi:hypothetical protein
MTSHEYLKSSDEGNLTRTLLIYVGGLHQEVLMDTKSRKRGKEEYTRISTLIHMTLCKEYKGEKLSGVVTLCH